MTNITMRYGAPGTDEAEEPVSQYTRLWTNEDPTASHGAMDLTLTESVSGYDALRIVWAYNTSAGATEDNWQDSDINAMAYIYDIRNKTDLIVSGSTKPNLGAVFYAASYAYARRGYFTDDVTIHFTTAYRLNNASSNTSILIPLFVDGVIL
jgi:hypothetical protein